MHPKTEFLLELTLELGVLPKRKERNYQSYRILLNRLGWLETDNFNNDISLICDKQHG